MQKCQRVNHLPIFFKCPLCRFENLRKFINFFKGKTGFSLPDYCIYLNFVIWFDWRTLLTKIFTVLVMARTRTVSKEVIRFSWLGRVVKKKLERARQQKLEMAKESRQRITSPTAILFHPRLCFWSLVLFVSKHLKIRACSSCFTRVAWDTGHYHWECERWVVKVIRRKQNRIPSSDGPFIRASPKRKRYCICTIPRGRLSSEDTIMVPRKRVFHCFFSQKLLILPYHWFFLFLNI